MKSLILVLSLATGPAMAATGHLKIECNGYDPTLNDHVESEGNINGTIAEWNGNQFRVSKKDQILVLTGTAAQVVINRETKMYVVYRWHGRRGARVEWSRPDQGDRCYFSN